MFGIAEVLAVLIALAVTAPAEAQLKTPGGNSAGVVTFEQTPNGVLIRASFDGLPAGEHAVHIHEAGRCEPPDFKSAGGHLSLAGHAHGFKNAKAPHAGDLPNIHVPESGTLRVDIFTDRISLRDAEANLLDRNGAAIVVHAKPDDYMTNPGGDAGDRIACGEIKG
jgi:Cu-Zn family superoxide dismutase